jgi:hypothetical protein
MKVGFSSSAAFIVVALSPHMAIVVVVIIRWTTMFDPIM